MDFKNIQNFLPLLHSLNKCHGNAERNIIMSHLDEDTFKFLCHWLDKGCKDPTLLKISNARLKKLRSVLQKDQKKLKYLTSGKGTTAKKRKIVRQSGEGIGMLLGILGPILIDVVVRALKNRKAKAEK